MARIDYYRDPAAPAANSLVPAVSAVVPTPDGRIVMQRRTDNQLWALPGGGMDIGESVVAATIREVQEETGLLVKPLYVVGVYSDPDHVFAYDDGEVRQEYSVCVACGPATGAMRPSHESTQVAAFLPAEIEELEIHERIRLRILDYLAGHRGQLR